MQVSTDPVPRLNGVTEFYPMIDIHHATTTHLREISNAGGNLGGRFFVLFILLGIGDSNNILVHLVSGNYLLC